MAECIFCRITAGEAEATVVHDDERVMVIKDINPKAPVHLLVLPKKHLASLNEAAAEDEGLLGHMLLVIKQMAKEHGVEESGFKTMINTGPDGGQIVGHLHFHLLGGEKLKTFV